MSLHDIGDAVRLFIDFKTLAGAAADPTTVTLTVQAPDGTTTTPAHSNPSTGRYEAVVTLDQAGVWVYRWEGTGVIDAAEEGAIGVRRGTLVPDEGGS
jgi:hypothetical protein